MLNKQSILRSHLARRRCGGALVETALVLSLLVMISMGAAQYGFAFYLKHALQEAASVACRAAVLPGATDSQVLTAATNQLSSSGFSSLNATTSTTINGTTTTISASTTTVNSVSTGTYVTVTVTASWTNVGINPLPTSLGGFASNRSFSASMTMLHE